MKRPLKNKRLLGPVFDFSNGEGSGSGEDIIIDDSEIEFTSMDDLPESPMLRQYVERQSEYLEADVVSIINSEPVKQYMRRLGVWEEAKRMNS